MRGVFSIMLDTRLRCKKGRAAAFRTGSYNGYSVQCLRAVFLIERDEINPLGIVEDPCRVQFQNVLFKFSFALLKKAVLLIPLIQLLMELIFAGAMDELAHHLLPFRLFNVAKGTHHTVAILIHLVSSFTGYMLRSACANQMTKI